MAFSTEHRDEGALLGRPLPDGLRAALKGLNRAAARQETGSTPSASSSATTCCRALGTTRDRDDADYDANVKRRERQAAHEQITQ